LRTGGAAHAIRNARTSEGGGERFVCGASAKLQQFRNNARKPPLYGPASAARSGSKGGRGELVVERLERDVAIGKKEKEEQKFAARRQAAQRRGSSPFFFAIRSTRRAGPRRASTNNLSGEPSGQERRGTRIVSGSNPLGHVSVRDADGRGPPAAK